MSDQYERPVRDGMWWCGKGWDGMWCGEGWDVVVWRDGMECGGVVRDGMWWCGGMGCVGVLRDGMWWCGEGLDVVVC